MTDTPADVDERYRAMLMERGGGAHLVMKCAMRETASAFFGCGSEPSGY